MAHEIRQRIRREATPEEKERHRILREQIAQELPDLKKWATEAAARQRDQVAVGTVLKAEEIVVLVAIDSYAAKYSLTGCSDWLRESLITLWGVVMFRQ